MYAAEDICSAIERLAEEQPDKPAYISRSGGSRSYAGLVRRARFVARELKLLGLCGRGAAVMGDVSYSGLCAVLGCLMASMPVIVADASLSREELADVLDEYGAGALFYSRRFSEKALAAAGRLPGLLPVPEFDELADDDCPPEAAPSPDDPAFVLFTQHEKKAALLTHKNICRSLRSLAGALDIGSYTFLCPQAWGGAFDLVVGLLLPLSAGCALIERGDRRSSARAVAESGATALTCTPERLVSLEKALKIRSVKTLGKPKTLLYDLVGRALGRLSPVAGRHSYRRIRALLGDSLKLIICGGAFVDADCVRRFASWGYYVYNCYFLTECGAAALSPASGEAPAPLLKAEMAPVSGDYGEIMLTPDEPVRYFGADAAEGVFATGDVGRLAEDGSLEICGRRKTMLLSGSGAPIFPEQLAAGLCRSRYISRASVSGRFDTGTSGIFVSAVITPDAKAVASALGSKYSDNRLRLFIGRELERMAPQLPHRIDEFRIAEKKS